MPEREFKVKHPTLVHALLSAAKTENGITFLDRGGASTFSYSELLTQSNSIANILSKEYGLRSGDNVILILPTGVELVTHYFACLLIGAKPCIQSTPRANASVEAGIEKFGKVLKILSPKLVLTSEKEKAKWGNLVENVLVLQPADIAETASSEKFTPNLPKEEDLVLLQATSGSTSLPKCIALTNRNVCSNCEQIAQQWDANENDRAVGWLPLFHDLGLIGTLLFPLYQGIDTVLLNPSQFMRMPVRWLQAISDYKGTMSPAPNFAYALVAAKVGPKDLENIDLSCWRVAVCGAERINPDTLRYFYRLVRKANFNLHALVPAYGLAEATVCVTADKPNLVPMVDSIDSEAHERPSLLSDTRSKNEISSSGVAVAQTTVKILSDEGVALREGEEGNICIAGPSVMGGYLNADGSVERPLLGGMLNTGDIGYLKGEQLFVSGRAKELIIIRGQNYFPTDFETAVSQVQECRASRIVAFGLEDSAGRSEEVHIVLELKLPDDTDEDMLKEKIAKHVAHKTGILPAKVTFVPGRTIPMTTSGKLQRNAFKKIYQEKLSSTVPVLG